MPDTCIAPPGWPSAVRPPDAPDWERTAVNWLFDICPPEYRALAALRRHVVVLARLTETGEVAGRVLKSTRSVPAFACSTMVSVWAAMATPKE